MTRAITGRWGFQSAICKNGVKSTECLIVIYTAMHGEKKNESLRAKWKGKLEKSKSMDLCVTDHLKKI